MSMDDEALQALLRQEQEEIALSIQYEGALSAIRAKNEESEKIMLQLEQELASVTSENETLARFRNFSQEQCFSTKAESYKINGEKQKAKQLLREIDQSAAYWKDVCNTGEEAAKSLDEHAKSLYKSPWVVQKAEAKEDIGQLNALYEELQQQLAELENARKFKSPRSSVDNQTVEMFRNMVRSELRLNPQRVVESQPPQRLDRSPSHAPTPPRAEKPNHPRLGSIETTSTPPRVERFGRLESTPARIQKEVPRRDSPPPQPQYVEAEPEDDTDTLGRMEFEDDNNSEQNQQSQEVEQDYEEAEEEREEEQNLFNDLSSDALHVSITDDQEGGGNDFYNLLGDNHGSNSDTPMFSFLQEHTNNSGDGGANFFFGTSSPQSKKDESSHGFLF